MYSDALYTYCGGIALTPDPFPREGEGRFAVADGDGAFGIRRSDDG